MGSFGVLPPLARGFLAKVHEKIPVLQPAAVPWPGLRGSACFLALPHAAFSPGPSYLYALHLDGC
jgi:hypothetical protein